MNASPFLSLSGRACDVLHKVPQKVVQYPPAISSNGQLDIANCTSSPSFPVHSPCPSLLPAGITPANNYLHIAFVLGFAFRGTQDKTLLLLIFLAVTLKMLIQLFIRYVHFQDGLDSCL